MITTLTHNGVLIERPDVPVQRCTVHKHRNLLAHALDVLHEEVTSDYTDMIYTETPKPFRTGRQAFLRKCSGSHCDRFSTSAGATDWV